MDMNSRRQLDGNDDPEAVKWKVRGHGFLTALTLVVCAMCILRGTLGGSSTDEAGVVLAGVAGFAALVHLLLAFCAPIHLTRRLILALVLVALAPLAYLLPKVARPAGGWPLNETGEGQARGEGMSRMIAPGDSVIIKWQEEGFTVVNSHWRGTPQVEVLNAAELGCAKTLAGTGRDDKWQGLILSNHKYGEHPPELRVQFRLPEDIAVGELPLRARITMLVHYPAPVGRSGFDERTTTVNRQVDIVIAPSQVKQMYWASWWVGAACGLAGTTVGGFMLMWLARGLHPRGARSESAPWERSCVGQVPAGSY